MRERRSIVEPEIIADYRNEVGEGPMWHAREGRLYWVDIPNGRIFHYDPPTGEHAQFYDGDTIGGFTIQEDGALLLFMEKGAVAVLRDGELSSVIEKLPGEEENRFNDVIADSSGRVLCGTMPLDSDRALAGERLGRLYLLDVDGSVTQLLDGIGISNGMGFTPDGAGLYYTDTMDRAITMFDYDRQTGDISNKRVFVETKGEGMPDGMTVDAEGYVWSARASGWSLYRYTPDGVEDRCIRFPAKLVSSVTFGGADLTDIYVTTIGGNNRPEDGPGAGALFRLNLGIKGVPEFLSRIGL